MIESADGKIWMALKQALDSFTECHVMLPMDVYEPKSTDTFIIVQHISTDWGGVLPVSIDCGSPLNGFMSLGVCCPVDWDYGQLVGLASRVADHFNDVGTYQYEDMTVRLSRQARVNGNVALQAPWNRLEVRVPWRAWG